MTRVPQEQRDRFLRVLAPAAQSVCPAYGLNPEDCIREAAAATSWGRFALGNNFWNLQGKGDSGFYLSVCPVRTYRAEGGGWQGSEEVLAKFSTPVQAVRAWCESKRRG